MQVQRPVDESTLDLDVTLEALASDGLDPGRLHVVGGFSPAVAEVKGHAPAPAATPNGSLREETIRETFSRFGAIRMVQLAGEAGRRGRHAQVGESLVVAGLLCAMDLCATCVRRVCQC